jgi:hypothetical protein
LRRRILHRQSNRNAQQGRSPKWSIHLIPLRIRQIIISHPAVTFDSTSDTGGSPRPPASPSSDTIACPECPGATIIERIGQAQPRSRLHEFSISTHTVPASEGFFDSEVRLPRLA